MNINIDIHNDFMFQVPTELEFGESHDRMRRKRKTIIFIYLYLSRLHEIYFDE